MYAVVDLETTGSKPAKQRIIEVAIYIHNGKRVIEHFSSLVNPHRYIPPFIQAFTGITNAMVANAPDFADLSDTIARLTANRVFVAHNVRFDYAFLRHEFKRCGVAFDRRQLCTVRLSRAIYPGQPSYSLGKLCGNLGLPVHSRHRAEGDAAATVQLLEQMLAKGPESVINKHIKEEVKGIRLPPHLSRQQLDALPEDHGIYYLMGPNNEPLYIGRSKNIRERMLSHFSRDLRSARAQNLKNAIHDIKTEQTGNALIAGLWESRAIKTYMPPFNRAQRRKRFRYGLFENLGRDGIRTLEVRLINQEQKPLKQFQRRSAAEAYLVEIAEQQGLCLADANLQQSVFGSGSACNYPGNCEKCPKNRMTEAAYEAHLDAAMAPFRYPWSNFIVMGAGRHPEEVSLVAVQDQQYAGFGLIESPEISDPDWLLEQVKPGLEAADAFGIIQRYLRHASRKNILKF